MLKPFKTRVVKLLSIIAPLLFLASCSPSKGYLGPTLPPEELAIVYYGACDNGSTIGKASSEGVEFDSSGIALLPGKRMIYVSAELIFSYSNCITNTKFDEEGYEDCKEERDEAIKNNNGYIPVCARYEFDRTTYTCNQEFESYLCSISNNLIKGKEYDACTYQLGNDLFTKLNMRDSSEPTLPVTKCQGTGEQNEQVELKHLP